MMKILSKVPIVLLIWGSLFLFFLLFLFLQRGIFLQQYDGKYWKDRYEHSRFQLPLSNRGIGDDALYAYGGYSILHGVDPTKVVYDKPAFGLAIIGVFVVTLGNPAYYGFFIGIATIIVFYLLARKILVDPLLSASSTVLAAINPLFLTQLQTSLLDIVQLFFLLLNIYAYQFIFAKNKHTGIIIFLSGLFLSFSMQTKIPVFFPVVFLLQWGYLQYRKKWRLAATFVVGMTVAVYIGYFIYFLFGYSFIEYIQIQKHIISIYHASALPSHYEAVWQFLFTGFFPHIVSRKPVVVEEWSLVMPVLTIGGFWAAWIFLVKAKATVLIKGFAITLFASGLILTLIPTYPRYVLFLFPFLYMLFFLYIQLYVHRIVRILFLSVLFIVGYIQAYIFLFPSPEKQIQRFYSDMTHMYFQDIYEENMTTESRPHISREQFFTQMYKTYQNGKIAAITIDQLSKTPSPFRDEGKITVKMTYHTEYLGSFAEIKDIRVKKEHNQWKVVWDWNYVIHGYKPNYSLHSERVLGVRGEIRQKNGMVFAKDDMGYLFSFTPSKMLPAQEDAMLTQLATYGNIKRMEIQNAYLENVPYGVTVPLFTTYIALTPTDKHVLQNFQGLTLHPYPARMYGNRKDMQLIKNTQFTSCCTSVYSSYNYVGDITVPKNPEAQYEKLLRGYDGGVLQLRDEKHTVIRELIKKTPKNGNDIIL